ncbi:UvrD-helicase domain-containing protein [Haloglycomyces albus]|uniref:UvrD-helicase domain-containing protein n=1 Tax=Haloglycomyces albus TaxID=526067 RepID=UPI00046D37AE|nr:ATP-dependent helicase [Haloglycomyces albus]
MIRSEYWQPVGGLELEPNALRAVTMVEDNAIVTAGPGAGKTELLAQRADFLFRTGVSWHPRRILAISFKVDAAWNLRDRVRTRSGGQYAARFDSFTFHAFAKTLIGNYRPILRGADALDPDFTIDAAYRIPRRQITFEDLIPLAHVIVANSQYARAALRQTYSHVFLDEFQDATKSQYELVKAIFQNTDSVLTAVGDDKQRIMGWAGALDGIMNTFSNDFDAAPLQLLQNFRSAPRLRRMQNRMIRDMDPSAASPDENLAGSEGTIQVLHFKDQIKEAEAVANRVEGWLAADVPPNEIAILVRQQSKFVTETLREELYQRNIAYRNEQVNQDRASEPVVALIFNFVRVVVSDRHPDAWSELMRVSARTSVSEEAALRFDRQLKQFLQDARVRVGAACFASGDLSAWRPVIFEFLKLVSRPALAALSPAYRQGKRLDDVVEDALEAFGSELVIAGDPIQAIKQLSDLDAVRILNIHKCKGLEFQKVVVLGVEQELFWGDDSESEFFVAISRAKEELFLTHVDYRARPNLPAKSFWREVRSACSTFLAYADGLTDRNLSN